MFSCEFCKATFVHKGSLTVHLKSAKYCLQMQGKESETQYCCSFCQKTFTSKTNLSVHLDGCTDRICHEYETKLSNVVEQYETKLKSSAEQYEDKIQSLIEENRKLSAEKQYWIDKFHFQSQYHHDSLIEIAKKPTTTVQNRNHNQINIYGALDLSVQNVQSILEKHLTTEVIGDGQVGLANMIHAELLTDKQHNKPLYVCTDTSRNNFMFQNSKGEMVKDIKAHALTSAIVDAGVGKRAMESISNAFQNDSARMNAYMPKAMEIANLHNQDSKFRGQLSKIAPKVDNGNENENNNENDDDGNDSVMSDSL